MALNPDIALQAGANVPQMDLLGSVTKAQNLLTAQQAQKASEAQTQTTLAQLPGVQADVAQKVRDEAGRKHLADNADKFYRIDAKTGKRTYDFAGAGISLAQNGFVDQAQSFIAKDLANRSAELVNSSTELKNADSVRDYIGKTHDLTKSAYQQAVLLASRSSPEEAPKIMERFYSGAKKNAEVLGTKVSPEVAAELSGMVDNEFTQALGGVNSANWPGATPVALKNVSELTISPQQQILNANTQETLRQGREGQRQTALTGGVTVGDDDPNSPQSQSARASAIAAGADPTIVANLSLVKLRQNPIIAGILANAPVTSAMRIGQKEEAVALESSKQLYDDAASIGRKAFVNLPSQPGSKLASKWNEVVMQGGDAAKVQAAIDRYNAENKGQEISVAQNGIDAVLARLKQKGIQLETVIKAKKQVATAPTTAQATNAPQLYKPGQIVSRGGKTYVFSGGNYKDPKNWKESK